MNKWNQNVKTNCDAMLHTDQLLIGDAYILNIVAAKPSSS